MISILIVDDHPLVRRGICDCIKEIPGFTISGEAGSAKEIFEFLKDTEVDIIALDISMPGLDGMEILKQIRIDFPNIKVLMLSMHPEEQFARRAFRNGAFGYLTKAEAPRELGRALIRISEGHKYITDFMSKELIEHLDSDFQKRRYELLSDREFQILILIAGGHSNADIAQQQSLSTKTVSTYRSRLLEKMHMHSDAELTRYAIENHLIE